MSTWTPSRPKAWAVAFGSAWLALQGGGNPPPPPDSTWAGQRLLGINSPTPYSFGSGAPYRNMRHQMRWTTGSFGNTLPPLKADGYPVAGTYPGAVVAVFNDAQVAGYEGTYKISLTGNNIPNAANGGTLSGFAYNAGTNKTTGNLVVTDSAQTLALQWGAISADFGALEIMQPGYNPGDTVLLTTQMAAMLSKAKVFRCMDQQHTNGIDLDPAQVDTTWTGSIAAAETHARHYINSVKGCMDVCAEINADPWLCMSPAADDNYIQQFVTRALQLLPANRVLGIGAGNEPFNTAGGFPSFPRYMIGAISAADAYSGYSQLSSVRKIVSISRSANKITIVLGQNHGWNVGDQVFQSVDNAFCPRGVYTLVTGTTGANLVFNHTGSDGSGTVDTWVDSYVYKAASANPLIAPVSGYGDASMLYPHPYVISIHYQIQRLKLAYDTAVALGKESRIFLARDTSFAQLPQPEDIALFRARAQYGNLNWLEGSNGGGFVMNGYMIPDDPNNLTTVNNVFTQLNAAFTSMTTQFIQKLNYLNRHGGLNSTPGKQRVYEWGQHIHQVRSGCGPSVKTANKTDSRMTTLLADLAQRMRNLGAGVMCFFTSGTNPNFAALTEVGAAWGLREGAMTAVDVQVKETWWNAQGAIDATPVAVDGLTWGNIVLKNVILPTANDGIGGFNGDLLIIGSNDTTPDYKVLVHVDVAGVKTFALDASAWFDNAGQTVALLVNGVQIASGTLPQANPFAGYPPQAISGTANLAVGYHWVSIRPVAPPRNNNGLYRLRCS